MIYETLKDSFLQGLFSITHGLEMHYLKARSVGTLKESWRYKTKL